MTFTKPFSRMIKMIINQYLWVILCHGLYQNVFKCDFPKLERFYRILWKIHRLRIAHSAHVESRALNITRMSVRSKTQRRMIFKTVNKNSWRNSSCWWNKPLHLFTPIKHHRYRYAAVRVWLHSSCSEFNPPDLRGAADLSRAFISSTGSEDGAALWWKIKMVCLVLVCTHGCAPRNGG